MRRALFGPIARVKGRLGLKTPRLHHGPPKANHAPSRSSAPSRAPWPARREVTPLKSSRSSGYDDSSGTSASRDVLKLQAPVRQRPSSPALPSRSVARALGRPHDGNGSPPSTKNPEFPPPAPKPIRPSVTPEAYSRRSTERAPLAPAC